ncbi:MAG: hypothetical protein GYB50_25405 [Rhodobacteraceae bacterium]|uniref:hypothetical protein n=1 Tax=Salipiger thiooxidans TaxID=282683 RepID=UPI001CFACB7C|nr:hypothetical protein [Salipiger thiooxidans]MBR9841190.1 hypothetical protein [Paracoccaceae bacterium]
MKKPRHPVSDHAVVRYLERVQGVDIDALRKAIGHRVDAAVADHEGASAVIIEGFRYCLTPEGVVATVLAVHRPERGQMIPRRREIDDA